MKRLLFLLLGAAVVLGGRRRIDYVYTTKALRDCVRDARILTDSYTQPVRDSLNISNFYHPSDHRPILVDYAF